MTDKHITLALDGTGGDNANAKSMAAAVRFAIVLHPDLKILVFGSQKLKDALDREKMDKDRYEFYSAPVQATAVWLSKRDIQTAPQIVLYVLPYQAVVLDLWWYCHVIFWVYCLI